MNDTPLHPIKGQVLVRQEPANNQLPSGLFIPQGHRDSYPDIGVVLDLGPGLINKQTGERIPFDVKVGDRVMFKRRANTAVNLDTREGVDERFKNILVLVEDDILGVLEEA